MHGQRSWWGSVRRAVVVVAAMGVLPLLAPGPVAAQSVADAVEACEPLTAVPELGPRACGGLEHGPWVAAQHCRRLPPAQEPVCPSIDGRPVHESAMQDHERSWLARALDLQRDLDLDVPLTEALILHTHNSGNSAAYGPSVTINDANQVLSVTDQLRLGIRGIELDLHWTPNPSGDPDQGYRAVVQCHGQTADTPVGAVHPGCSVDRTFDQHLTELAEWLRSPAADGELVLLYLENQLEGDEAAHASAAASLRRHLGDLIYAPEAGAGCQALPVARTKREITAGGARVLITGNCGPSGWTDLVFERGTAWDESGSSTDYLAGSTCEQERAAGAYPTTFVRRYEDSTFVSLMANGGSHISPAVAADMVRCGVNLPGFDQVHPGDERLPALVWSWAPDGDPEGAAACAAQGDDGRFRARPCDAALPVACRAVDGGWAVSADPVAWADGDSACQAGGHPGAGVPANGWDNELLRRATEGLGDVWLAYGRQDGAWTVGIPADAPDEGDGGGEDGEQTGRRPDHAGRPAEPGRPTSTGDAGGQPSAVAGVDLARTATTSGTDPMRVTIVLAALSLVALAGGGSLRRRRRAR